MIEEKAIALKCLYDPCTCCRTTGCSYLDSCGNEVVCPRHKNVHGRITKKTRGSYHTSIFSKHLGSKLRIFNNAFSFLVFVIFDISSAVCLVLGKNDLVSFFLRAQRRFLLV